MVISDPRHIEWSAQISQKQDEHNIYVIMKTMCHLYYAPCLAYRALFGSLVPAMCNLRQSPRFFSSNFC